MMKKTVLYIFILAAFAVNAQIDRTKQPTPGPAPVINLGTPQTFQLANGLKVLVVENHKLPRVSYTLTIDNPPHTEGAKAGVGQLMGSLLGKGSASIDKDTYNEEVDYMGAVISFNAEGGFARGLSKYAERVLELMADAAINPNFTEEEFNKEKDLLLEGLKSNEKSVTTAARRVETALAYGLKHPYGEYVSQETVNNVTLNDINTYYRNYFVPKNAYLVVVGDVDYRTVEQQVTKYFGGWEKRAPLSVSYSKPKNPLYSQINFLDMPNAVQSEIAVQNVVDLKMTDEDYFPVLIANKILGGGAEARLFVNLREDKGYTYGAYSNVGADRYASRFRASASVRNAVTDSAVTAFLDELYRIRNERVSQQDLILAKADYVGSFVMALERPETIARYALNIETEGLPKDFYVSYLSKINAVTAEQVQEAAKKYFSVDNMRIVITGKGSDVLKSLENYTYKGKRIPISYFDKYANKIDRPVYEVKTPEGVSAKSVIEKYINAIGGKKKVEAVNSLFINAEGNAQGMALNMEVKVTSKNQFAMDLKMMGNSLSKQVINGDSGYIMAQGQQMPIPEEEFSKIKDASLPFPELYYLTKDDLVIDGIEDLEGKSAYVVKVADNKVNYYDVETGLKVKEITTIEAQGQVITQEVGLGNYQEVSGISFPFTQKQSFGPQSIEFTIKEIKINEGVTEEDFK
ncbi:pitrilysin family protein [Leptobacterium sp. I13]|uniref:M16 family metallopeptidase n=1 Tax=Leptobacterium meishanense TaxID=3128904 RepID=UPI0030EBF67B